MSRALIILTSKEQRDKASRWAQTAPYGTRVEFKQTKRTLPQNDRLHAMITDIANQLAWHGMKLSVDDWKLVFMDALRREMRIVPNIDGTGFVNLGRSTSKLEKQEFSDLIEIVNKFAADHGITFNDPAEGSPTSTEEAGDTAPHSPASSPSDQHWTWLRSITRMLVAATNYGGDLEILKNQKKAALASYEKPADCPEIITGKAQAVFGYCVQIVKQELEPEDGLAIIAGVCGCEPDDLTGRA